MHSTEVRAYVQRYFRRCEYQRTRHGRTETVRAPETVWANAKFQPSRQFMLAMLAEVAMEVKRLKDAMDFPGGSLHPPCLGGGALSKSAG